MWRKRKVSLPHYNSAPNPTASGDHTPTTDSSSRRSRLAIALGPVSNHRTQNCSRIQTSVDNADTAREEWGEPDSIEHIAALDLKIWTTIEVEEDGTSELLLPCTKRTIYYVRRAAVE